MSYVHDSVTLPAAIVARLRASVDVARVVTFRKTGPLTATEQGLPPELVQEVRTALPFRDQPSVGVYVRRHGALASEIAALAPEHRTGAIAVALDVSRDTVRRHARGSCARLPARDPQLADTVAGLAAIRHRHRIDQRVVAQALGVGQSTLSAWEVQENTPVERVESWIGALSVILRVNRAALARQAGEAGAALRAVHEIRGANAE